MSMPNFPIGIPTTNSGNPIETMVKNAMKEAFSEILDEKLAPIMEILEKLDTTNVRSAS